MYVKDDYDEGKMTKLRSNYVCENALYTYAKNLGFPKYLRLGKGSANSKKEAEQESARDAFSKLQKK